MTKQNDQPQPETIRDEQLEQVTGGLLLPAVQKVREAAARLQVAPNACDGSV